MKSLLLASACALALVFTGGVRPAAAQFSQFYGPLYRPGLYPYGTPGLSPYLDLTRGGNRAANYFLGTVPEIERRRNAADFGAAILDLERRPAAVETNAEEQVPTFSSTGHPVAFMSYYPYYLLGPTGNAPGRQQAPLLQQRR
jgi:hypothetical protein